MRWDGWGDPGRAQALQPHLLALVEMAFGHDRLSPRPVRLGDIRLACPALDQADLAALTAVTDAGRLSTAAEQRVRHACGRSTADLIRLRSGNLDAAPDAIIWPTSHDEIAALLAVCSDRRIGVIPRAGGTSVVGGLDAVRAGLRGIVALDLTRMCRMLGLDEKSRVAVFEPGIRGVAAERELAARGFTLGHFPQSFEWASVGGFAAARSAGQASAGYGRFEDMVVALRAATPVGELRTVSVPASAAGPDLRRLLVGSEGAFGVITELTLSVSVVPEMRRYEGWRFESFEAGAEAVRHLAQNGPLPAVLRLSDQAETAIGLSDPASAGGAGADGSLLIAGFEGRARAVTESREAAATMLAGCGGTPLGAGPGEAWARGRFEAPYLRDALLDAGVFVETLETAGLWTGLDALYQAVRDALARALTEAGTPPVVMCHISHVYPVGASLYFTIACALTDRSLDGWSSAKTAAGAAIAANGGTITHHHGIGTYHRHHYASEIGPAGMAALNGVKAALDPHGICNPGVLLG